MRLVLHFDINGTIIANDSTEVGTKEENANMVLSKSVYGKIINNLWQLNKDYHDKKDSISYYDYLKLNSLSILAEPVTAYSGNSGVADINLNQLGYKKKSFLFTEKGNPGESLQHLVKPVMDAMDSFFFKSFLRILDKYPEAKIILRTFGLDGDDVVERLGKIYPRIRDTIKGKFNYTDDIPVLTLENDKILVGMDEVNNFIKSAPNNLLFFENYAYWNGHRRDKTCGKLLLGDPEMVQIFFDDNVCVNILNDKNAYYVEVNTLKALLDETYFDAFLSDVLYMHKIYQ